MLRFIVVVLALVLSHACGAISAAASNPPLVKLAFEDIPEEIVLDETLWDQKSDLLRSIVRTLQYLMSSDAVAAYAAFEAQGITRVQVADSLLRFFFILLQSRSYTELDRRVRNEFSVFRSTGTDGAGSVRFTGYFQPVYQASRSRTAAYRYPIFTKPAAFGSWPVPHPTRVKLEGYDGLGGPETLLAGLELAWLPSRFHVFMIQVQGSAILELDDGSRMSVGFAAGTDYPFKGIPGEFLRKHKIAWHKLGDYFVKYPDDLNVLMAQNNRFIFFEERSTPDPVGSLGIPVVAERSIAIDKLRLPPGAVGIIRTKIPIDTADGRLRLINTSRIVLNLDSGSAIKGPGRVDVFMGTGPDAQRKASSVFSMGELYYLFPK